jgi:hypothetical protein
MDLKDLEAVITKLTPLSKHKLKLFVWETTSQGSPIIRNVIIEFVNVAEVRVKDIIVAIDKVTPITAIMFDCEGCGEIYRVKKTEDSMKKPCESC